MSAPAVGRPPLYQSGQYSTYPQRRPASSGAGVGAPRSFQYQFQQQRQQQQQQPQQQPQHTRSTSAVSDRPENSTAVVTTRSRRLSSSNGSSSIPVAVSSTSVPQGPLARSGPPPRPPQASGPPSLRPRSSSWGTTSPSAQAANAWRLKTLQSSRTTDEFVRTLPDEVLGLIVDKLRLLHLGASSESCATCWMRDVCALALACKQWLPVARAALYENVYIIGLDSAVARKKFKLAQGSRILLLRRTIRSNSQLAAHVRSLKVPSPLSTTSARELGDYLDLVATVVMACPNLERLIGLGPRYNHTYTRLFHALGSRPRLKQMEWVLEAPPPLLPPSKKQISKNKASPPMSAAPADLGPAESGAFLGMHSWWRNLTTFTIHCQPNAPVMSSAVMTRTLARLPLLQNLYLSHVPAMTFGDDNLLGLPASLHSLSLSHTMGVTSAGLSAFATQSASRLTLTSLTLRHVRLDSLAVLARILLNLPRLETLAVVLAQPPALDEDTFIWLMPYLASPTLKKLHWDMTSQATTPTPSGADSILARSIAASGFPNLRQLRVLNDPDGTFQSLCRPVERIDLPSDRFRVNDATNAASPPTLMQMAATTTPPTSLSPPLSSPYSPSSAVEPAAAAIECTNLVQARRAAQARLEAAHYRPRFVVNVVDHSEEPDDNTSIVETTGAGGVLVDKFNVGGFIGTVGSPVSYHLLPDPDGGSDARGGLVDVADLVMGSDPLVLAEDLGATGIAGCIGRWNSGVQGAAAGGAGAHYEKNSKQGRWWHTERARWSPVVLS